MAAFSARALSDSETQQIHAVSLRVLAEVGVDVCHETMRARLLAAGAAEGATNTRVRFPAGMVAEALARCPAEIAWVPSGATLIGWPPGIDCIVPA